MFQLEHYSTLSGSAIGLLVTADRTWCYTLLLCVGRHSTAHRLSIKFWGVKCVELYLHSPVVYNEAQLR
jgi:hypothetical protein